MRVLADLHGGNLEDREAKLEFREIKDKVVADVKQPYVCGCHHFLNCKFSAKSRRYTVI